MIGFCSATLAVIAASMPPAAGLSLNGNPLASGLQQFRVAYRAWDLDRLAEAARTLEDTCRETPQDAAAWHWLGVTRFHILVLRGGDEGVLLDDREFSRLLGEARKALKAAVRIDESDAEAYALLGTLAGMEIDRASYKALWLGPAVSRYLRSAMTHGESNPRAQYLLGAALVKGPASLGGKDEGLARLQRAEQLFRSAGEATEGSSTGTPQWGREHCLVLIGQVYAGRGDTTKAVGYYKKALELNPNHGLAQRCLAAVQEDARNDG